MGWRTQCHSRCSTPSFHIRFIHALVHHFELPLVKVFHFPTWMWLVLWRSQRLSFHRSTRNKHTNIALYAAAEVNTRMQKGCGGKNEGGAEWGRGRPDRTISRAFTSACTTGRQSCTLIHTCTFCAGAGSKIESFCSNAAGTASHGECRPEVIR